MVSADIESYRGFIIIYVSQFRYLFLVWGVHIWYWGWGGRFVPRKIYPYRSIRTAWCTAIYQNKHFSKCVCSCCSGWFHSILATSVFTFHKRQCISTYEFTGPIGGMCKIKIKYQFNHIVLDIVTSDV